MGGNASRAAARKAVKPLKNVNVEERAHKTIERHRAEPVVAPRHPTSKEKIEKQVADHPEIKEELRKQDSSLIDRMNRLQVDMVDDMPKMKSQDRPLPQRRDNFILDPLLAFEEPRKIPKGTISLRQLQSILNQPEADRQLHRAEKLAGEYVLNTQDAVNVLQYFENININEKSDELPNVQNVKWTYDPDQDESLKPR